MKKHLLIFTVSIEHLPPEFTKAISMWSRFAVDNYVQYVEPIPTDKLSNKQRKLFTNLNAKLAKIEDIIKNEVIKLTTFGNTKIADKNDYIDDYEIECYFTFLLDENDPAYNETDENILVELRYCSKHSRWIWSESNNNHNEFIIP